MKPGAEYIRKRDRMACYIADINAYGSILMKYSDRRSGAWFVSAEQLQKLYRPKEAHSA